MGFVQVTCQLHVSGKDYRHLESIQNMFVPLIVKLLKQISQYKGFYNKNGKEHCICADEEQDLLSGFTNDS